MSENANFVQNASAAIKQLMEQNTKQCQEISDLTVKCASLEAIHMGLIASIATSSPEIYSAIKKNAERDLLQIVEQNYNAEYLVRCLKTIAGISEQKQPNLWLVPPKV